MIISDDPGESRAARHRGVNGKYNIQLKEVIESCKNSWVSCRQQTLMLEFLTYLNFKFMVDKIDHICYNTIPLDTEDIEARGALIDGEFAGILFCKTVLERQMIFVA